MRFSKVVLAFIALCSPLELHAQCFICDEVVEMNAAGAACFLEKRSEYEAELQSGSDGFVEVNLNECIGTDVSASRGGVEVMPRLAPSDGGVDKTVYTLDQSGLTCLADLVLQTNEFDPSRQFDLIEDCTQ